MARARGSGGTPSKASGKGKRKQRDAEDEVQSKKKRVDSSNKVLKFDFCMNVKRFEDFMTLYDGKKVLKGRVYDFVSLGNYTDGLDLEVSMWLKFQGWDTIFSFQAPTYPRLVQILMCNYNQTSRQSWIGKYKFDLSPSGLRNTLGLDEVEEEEFEWPAKEEIFREIANRELDRHYVYLPAKFLSLDQKLAHNVIFHMIYPKIGSSDQVPEKDARLIWALEKKKKLDLSKLMSEHLDFMKTNIGKVSLPYGMYWTKFFIKAGMDLSAESADYFKNSDIINMTTIKRMGFKLTADGWTQVKGPRVEEVQAPAQTTRRPQEAERRTEREDESEEEAEEEETAEARDSILESAMRSVEPTLPQEAAAAAASPSTAPSIRSTRSHPQTFPSPAPPTRPRSSRHPSPTQFSSQQLKSLKAFITTSLTKLESTLTHRIDTLNLRVDNLDLKLDTITALIESSQPPKRPDPYREKMKGIVIEEPESSSSDQPDYHISPRPSQPFFPTIPSQPSPQPSQPVPKPVHQASPQPSPQPSSKQASPQTEAALTLAAMPSTKPKPTPEPSSSATISDKPCPTLSPKPSPKPSPSRSPIPPPAQPLLALTWGEEVGETGEASSSHQPKPSEPQNAPKTSSSKALSSDSSSSSPSFPVIAPIQSKPPTPPPAQPPRPPLILTLDEFQRRSLENRKVMDLKIAAFNENRPDTYSLPYPELTDPESHKFIKIVSSFQDPTSLPGQPPRTLYQGPLHDQPQTTHAPDSTPKSPNQPQPVSPPPPKSSRIKRSITKAYKPTLSPIQPSAEPKPSPSIDSQSSSQSPPIPFYKPESSSYSKPQLIPQPQLEPLPYPARKRAPAKPKAKASAKSKAPAKPKAQAKPKPTDASPYLKTFTRKKPQPQPKGA